MKCDTCGKGEATVHEVTIRNGKKVERHLCESCARGEGIPVQSHAPVAQILTQFIAEQVNVVAGASGETARSGECPTCGLTYAQFRHGGLLGCPDCYAAFDAQLGPLLSRAHEGGTHHTGKVPRRVSGVLSRAAVAGVPPTRASAAAIAGREDRRRRIAQLRERLNEAVQAEQYELAARLRDELRRLEMQEASGEGDRR